MRCRPVLSFTIALAGCGYEPNPDAPFIISASNSVAGDGFGTEVVVAPDGGRLAIGAPTDDGHVSVFERDESGDWVSLGEARGNPGDGLGAGLAMSGDGSTLAMTSARRPSIWVIDDVGQPSARESWLEPSTASEALGPPAIGWDGTVVVVGDPREGVVHVFTRTSVDDVMWSASAVESSRTVERFGASVALSGDGSALAVASDLDPSVHMFVHDGASFAPISELELAPDESGLGRPLALSRDAEILVVGAPGEQEEAGAIYVFTRDLEGQDWSLTTYGTMVDARAGDRLGASVAMSRYGSLFAVGAPREGGTGVVYVVLRVDGLWTIIDVVTRPSVPTFPPSDFGAAIDVSADGHQVVVGAAGAADEPGIAYVYGI